MKWVINPISFTHYFSFTSDGFIEFLSIDIIELWIFFSHIMNDD